MSRLLIIIFLLLQVSTALAGGSDRKADPRTMTFQELRFEIPSAERVVLDCGMPVYLLQDRELPIVSVTAMVHVGSIYDPPGLTGLAGLTGSVMRSGGAGGVTPEVMDDELEFMAAAVESGIGSDMGTVSMTSLTKHLGRTLTIFSDVLLKPDFAEKRVDIARKQLVEALRRQNDDPKGIAGREIARAIYGSHPLGAVPTFATAAAITRQGMIDFHRRYFRTDNMLLAVAGDFDRNDILSRLNELFPKRAAAEPRALPVVPQPPAEFSATVLYGKKDVNQSVIRMGHLGLTKDAPDLHAVRILDYILGGSFTSRLTMEIRTNQGLAYNVDSHFDIGRLYTGTFIAETETKAESTAKTIGLMQKLIADMTREPVTDQELKLAKEYIINSFMFGFTSPSSIVTQRARLEFYGYRPDYLDRYRERIAAVSSADVLAAARRYLKPEAFKLVVIGNSEQFDKPLSSFGTVKELDLTTHKEPGR